MAAVCTGACGLRVLRQGGEYSLFVNNRILRETFLFNQLRQIYPVHFTQAGDFLVDHRLVFEVGGKGKTFEQIKNEPRAWLALDDIETGHGNSPLSLSPGLPIFCQKGQMYRSVAAGFIGGDGAGPEEVAGAEIESRES